MLHEPPPLLVQLLVVVEFVAPAAGEVQLDRAAVVGIRKEVMTIATPSAFLILTGFFISIS